MMSFVQGKNEELWKRNTEIEYHHLHKKPHFFLFIPTSHSWSNVTSSAKCCSKYPPPQLPHSRWGLCHGNNCSHSSFVTLRRLFFSLSNLSTCNFRIQHWERTTFLFTSFSKKKKKKGNNQYNPPPPAPPPPPSSVKSTSLKIQTQAQWFFFNL